MQAKAAPEYNHLSMAYSLRKEHKHSIVIGHANSENLLQPIKSTTQFRVVGW